MAKKEGTADDRRGCIGNPSIPTAMVPAQSAVAPPQQVPGPVGFAEIMPSYPGGVKALNRFLNRELTYPPDGT